MTHHNNLFQRVSGAASEAIRQAKNFFSDLPGMDGNLVGAANTIRNDTSRLLSLPQKVLHPIDDLPIRGDHFFSERRQLLAARRI